MSTSPLRHFARASDREPTPVSKLSRSQLVGRIVAVRQALDLLSVQREMDGGETFDSTGRLKIELMRLEGDLSERDRAEGLVPASPMDGYAPGMPMDVALAYWSEQQRLAEEAQAHEAAEQFDREQQAGRSA